MVVLTVMSTAIAIDSSKHNGIEWDGIISCEFLGHYKPDREAYLGGLRLLGVEPGQAMMCAAHHGDLRAAMAAGLRSAYVPRPGESGDGERRRPVAAARLRRQRARLHRSGRSAAGLSGLGQRHRARIHVASARRMGYVPGARRAR